MNPDTDLERSLLQLTSFLLLWVAIGAAILLLLIFIMEPFTLLFAVFFLLAVWCVARW